MLQYSKIKEANDVMLMILHKKRLNKSEPIALNNSNTCNKNLLFCNFFYCCAIIL